MVRIDFVAKLSDMLESASHIYLLACWWFISNQSIERLALNYHQLDRFGSVQLLLARPHLRGEWLCVLVLEVLALDWLRLRRLVETMRDLDDVDGDKPTVNSLSHSRYVSERLRQHYQRLHHQDHYNLDLIVSKPGHCS